MNYLTRCALAEAEEEKANTIRLEEEEIYTELLAKHRAINFYSRDDEETAFFLLGPRAHVLAMERYKAI